MAISLLLVSLIGYFLFIAKICRWSVATTPLFAVCMIPGILYIFGIFNMLAIGAHFLFYLGIAFFAGYFFLCFKEKQISCEEIFNPGLILFIVYFIFLYSVCRALSYRGWDEFSHWGLVTKDLVFSNRLITSESAVALKSYPPGMALFHYFVVSVTGYSEGMVYFAQNVFLAAAFTALFQKIKWKQFYLLVILFLITYNLIFFFGEFIFRSLNTDHIVGVVFGISLASYFLFEGSNTGRIGHLIPALFLLPLIKQIGFFFAICVLVIIISDYLFCLFYGEWLVKRDQFVENNLKPGGSKLLTLILLAGIVAAPLISNISWKGWLNKNKIDGIFSTNISLDKIKKSFSKENATPRDKETLKNFQEAFLKEPLLSGALNSYWGELIPNKQTMSAVSCLFVCLILVLAGILLQPTNRERYRVLICHAYMVIFFVIYCFVHLLLYLYSFNAYEGSRIVSFGRYISIYFLGWSFVFIAFFVAVPRKLIVRYSLSRLSLTIILIILIILTPLSNKDFLLGKDLPMPIRTEVEQFLPIVQKNCSLNSKIYFIWQNDKIRGFKSWIFAYGISPRRTNMGGGWSLGKPYYEGDVWTADYTPEQLSNVLREYDYILTAKADEKFWEIYGSLFNGVDFTKYSSALNARKIHLGNLMRDGTIKAIEQGPAPWFKWIVAGVNDGSTDNAYGFTGGGAKTSNNDRGMTLTFKRRVALTTLVHWSFSNLIFNYVIECYTDGVWVPVATVVCPKGNPTVISFNTDRSKSSNQWRWYISDWKSLRTNFYAYELEAYESGAYESLQASLKYIDSFNDGSLFKITKNPDENIFIQKIE